MKGSLTLLLMIFFAFSPDGAEAQSLRGSRTVQAQQNRQADRENLTAIKDLAQLRRFVRAGLLVRLPNDKNIVVDPRLDGRYRYCRPWTRDWLSALGRAYRKEFPKSDPLVVTSAVRTAAYQGSLRGRNGNAAPTPGLRASAHLRGSTIDITKKDLSGRELTWLRNYVRLFKAQNRGIVIEEFRQAVFHVMVFKPVPKKKK